MAPLTTSQTLARLSEPSCTKSPSPRIVSRRYFSCSPYHWLSACFHTESRAVASCANFDADALLRTTDCQTFTLFPGDVLYLPKAVIHFATTGPGQVSAHLTVSIDRESRTWQDLLTTASLMTGHPAAGLVQEVLLDAANTYQGMPWYEIPSHDHRRACQQLHKLVLGAQPWSLRSLLRQTKRASKWMSPSATRSLLQQLGRCQSDIGEDLHGVMLAGRNLVHATSLKIKQRHRRALVSFNCGNTCICRSCTGSGCNVGCVRPTFSDLVELTYDGTRLF